MKYIDFKNIEYLKYGNEKQIKSYNILTNINIFNILKEYTPVLVGTIPIDIDINTSDLDIICEVRDFVGFIYVLKQNFSGYDDFKVDCHAENIVVCNFKAQEIEIEIYASKENVDKANGYRHMLVEYRIMNLLGKDFKNNIIKLKEDGMKTEPAFAKLLKLDGNPYDELLLFEKYLDEDIINHFKRLERI
ncbi:DUF4269 domain-containing protein [Romboutsia weinsteinii]|uniref:DUF4269 domain-containing protein n=1 Tax=Romboutsia weinsteinii TaxID=2020949 RepID=A0A371J8D4_9FIRM|nr:DUF4269 domain-containing protein [Romboutsia weinsteinii]RDY29019.1 DUF4269 domain-containing protein [Romboutsia weinsteinii]